MDMLEGETSSHSFRGMVLDINKVDWCKIWETQVRAFRAEAGWKGPEERWNKPERAVEFWRSAKTSQSERIKATLQGLVLKKEFRVLDIGCGPGNLTIPIAQQVTHVTAIDASQAMIEHLQAKAKENQMGNITAFVKSWEDVEIETDLGSDYDLILASLCWDMLDAGAALKKMRQVTRGYIHCICHAGEPAWKSLKRKVYQKLHGREVLSLPKVDVLFNILYQWGIYPETQIYKYNYIEEFSSKKEAITHYLEEFGLSAEGDADHLWEILKEWKIKEDDIIQYAFPSVCMKLSWQEKGSN